jgi:ABC-type antimicrobial peptide transport system permease subunit
MMLNNNIKMAVASLKSTKWRSLLTVLGIIIGIVSVVTAVSLGGGVKHQIIGQIDDLGSELITVRPGRVVSRDDHGNISHISLFNLFGAGALSEQDWQTVEKTPGVDVAVPLGLVTGTARTDEREFSSGFIMATSARAPEILNKKVEYGEFFKADETKQNFAVIGSRVAEQLFQENVPIGKTLEIRGKSFIVRGILQEFETSPLTPNTDYNSAIFIPYEVGKQLNNGHVQIYQILVKPKDASKRDSVVQAINDQLLAAHGGQNDFTVLKQEENLALASKVLNLLTALIAGVAAISLLVGGIGIMNIMLVSVTERTQEIGIRKAVGATNRQILSQFLVEAAVLSFAGGLLGVLLSVLINYLLRIFTNLQPVITLPVVLIATGVAFLVGLVFGVMPAMRAARKDPIEALRHQ